MKDLAGKTAVITGAASGMGPAFAERLAEAGMNIVLADVEVPRLEEATASVRARGVEAIAVPTDVSDAEAVERLRDAALARFGRVNLGPEWAAPRSLEEEPVDERAALVREFLLDQLNSGMAPARVADMVHDAVVHDRFWIFTDMAMVAALEPRHHAVLAAENPPQIGPSRRD